MHNIQDKQTTLDHTQPDTRSNVHRIEVMEKTAVKKANDGLGDYTEVGEEAGNEGAQGASTGNAGAQGASTGNAGPQGAPAGNAGPQGAPVGNAGAQGASAGNAGAQGASAGNAGAQGGKKDKGTQTKDTVVIVDPSSLDSGKGGCWSRFKKFCCENKWVVGLICILIFVCLVLLILLIIEASRVAEGPSSLPTSSPGVTTGPPSTPGPPGPSTAPPSPGVVMQGIMTTTDNYTEALTDPTSLVFKSFENNVAAAVMCFYADNHTEYLGYYIDTQVTSIESSILKTTVVHFEVLFSQLDDDNALPDAHSVLLNQLRDGRRLGSIIIIGDPTLNENSN